MKCEKNTLHIFFLYSMEPKMLCQQLSDKRFRTQDKREDHVMSYVDMTQ